MTNDNEYGIDNPEGAGIQNLEAPGEPDYWSHPVSNPVPGTAKQTRDEREGRDEQGSEGSGHETGRGGRGGHGGHH